MFYDVMLLLPKSNNPNRNPINVTRINKVIGSSSIKHNNINNINNLRIGLPNRSKISSSSSFSYIKFAAYTTSQLVQVSNTKEVDSLDLPAMFSPINKKKNEIFKSIQQNSSISYSPPTFMHLERKKKSTFSSSCNQLRRVSKDLQDEIESLSDQERCGERRVRFSLFMSPGSSPLYNNFNEFEAKKTFGKFLFQKMSIPLKNNPIKSSIINNHIITKIHDSALTPFKRQQNREVQIWTSSFGSNRRIMLSSPLAKMAPKSKKKDNFSLENLKSISEISYKTDITKYNNSPCPKRFSNNSLLSISQEIHKIKLNAVVASSSSSSSSIIFSKKNPHQPDDKENNNLFFTEYQSKINNTKNKEMMNNSDNNNNNLSSVCHKRKADADSLKQSVFINRKRKTVEFQECDRENQLTKMVFSRKPDFNYQPIRLQRPFSRAATPLHPEANSLLFCPMPPPSSSSQFTTGQLGNSIVKRNTLLRPQLLNIQGASVAFGKMELN